MECLVIIENENVHKNHLLLLSCSVNLGPLLEESPCSVLSEIHVFGGHFGSIIGAILNLKHINNIIL